MSVGPVSSPFRGRGGRGGRTPGGPRAGLGLGSPRVPSSFARPELRCSRRPEPRGRAALGGPEGRAAVPVPGPGEAQTPRGAAWRDPRGRPGGITTLRFASAGRGLSYFVAGSGWLRLRGREPFPDRPWACGVCLQRLRGCSAPSSKRRYVPVLVGNEMAQVLASGQWRPEGTWAAVWCKGQKVVLP